MIQTDVFVSVYSAASGEPNQLRPTEQQWQELIRLTPDMCLFYFYFLCLIMLACDMDGVASPKGWYLVPIMLAEISSLMFVLLPVAVPFLLIHWWDYKQNYLTKKCAEQDCSEWSKYMLVFWLDERMGLKNCADKLSQMGDITTRDLLAANDSVLGGLGLSTSLERRRLRFGLLFNGSPDALSLRDKDWYKKWDETPEHLRRAYTYILSVTIKRSLLQVMFKASTVNGFERRGVRNWDWTVGLLASMDCLVETL